MTDKRLPKLEQLRASVLDHSRVWSNDTIRHACVTDHDRFGMWEVGWRLGDTFHELEEEVEDA